MIHYIVLLQDNETKLEGFQETQYKAYTHICTYIVDILMLKNINKTTYPN